MPLKDWKKTRKDAWIHKFKRKGKGYDYRGNVYGFKEIWIFYSPYGYYMLKSGKGMIPNKISPYFKTKSKARMFAINYMRKH